MQFASRLLLPRAQEYVSMAFSPDGKLLLAQGGAPEWNLVLWVWEKSKVAATIKTTNQQGLPVSSVSGATDMGMGTHIACGGTRALPAPACCGDAPHSHTCLPEHA